eukprot:Phypoly_transcript_03553.p1 GENE.Phypoly_transcript_03553~~Phypoly_transcript_03553.p1  ORF type:complete len:793 (+),score=184.11 Phypoly_transcript_03553:246-2381(+)
MNRLLDVPNGFALGDTVDGVTRGIWVWGKDEGDSVLICLDTEGLFDPQNRSASLDAKIFAITIMIVSLLIYNVMRTIDENQIMQLHLITELVKHIHTTKDNANKGSDIGLFLPPLMWLIRDFTLTLPSDAPTPQDYLMKCLTPLAGEDDDTDRANRVRDKLKRMIPELSCETLPFPTRAAKDMLIMETDPTVLVPEFKRQSDVLIQKLLSKAEVKTVRGQGNLIKLDGPAYLCFVETMVTAINNDKAFVIPDAFDAIAFQQTLKAANEAERMYREALDSLQESFPIDSKELEEVHMKALDDAMAHLAKNVMGDRQEITRQFRDGIEVRNGNELQGGIYFTYCAKNKTASEVQCANIWDSLVKPIREKVASSSYQNINEFQQDVQQAKETYNTNAKGPAKEPYRVRFEEALEKDYVNLMNKLQLDELEKRSIIDAKKAEEMARILEETKKENGRLAEESEKRLLQFQEQHRKMEEMMATDRKEFEARLARDRQEMEQKLERAKKRNDKKLQEELQGQRKALEAQYQKEQQEREEQKKQKEERRRKKEEQQQQQESQLWQLLSEFQQKMDLQMERENKRYAEEKKQAEERAQKEKAERQKEKEKRQKEQEQLQREQQRQKEQQQNKEEQKKKQEEMARKLEQFDREERRWQEMERRREEKEREERREREERMAERRRQAEQDAARQVFCPMPGPIVHGPPIMPGPVVPFPFWF